MNKLTWRDLKEQLNHLPEEQLDELVSVGILWTHLDECSLHNVHSFGTVGHIVSNLEDGDIKETLLEGSDESNFFMICWD